MLEGGFTRSELTLHERGHDREVAQGRLAMQSSIEGELRAAVEAILQRPVRSFMSANDPGNDLQAEIFVLHPDESLNGDLPARAKRARDHHRELLDEHRALRSEQVQSRRALHPQDDGTDAGPPALPQHPGPAAR